MIEKKLITTLQLLEKLEEKTEGELREEIKEARSNIGQYAKNEAYESMTEYNDEYDTTEKVEQTETGYRLTIESTRGTGTRDQDRVKVEGKAETWEKLNSQRTAMRTAVVVEMNQRRLHKPDETENE